MGYGQRTALLPAASHPETKCLQTLTQSLPPVQEPLAGQTACMKGDSSRQQCQASASPHSCPSDPLCPGLSSAHSFSLRTCPALFPALKSSCPPPIFSCPCRSLSTRTQLKSCFLRGDITAFRIIYPVINAHIPLDFFITFITIAIN